MKLKIELLDIIGLFVGGAGLYLFLTSQVLSTVWVGFILVMCSLLGIGMRKR